MYLFQHPHGFARELSTGLAWLSTREGEHFHLGHNVKHRREHPHLRLMQEQHKKRMNRQIEQSETQSIS